MSNSEPLISVIITAYNRKEYLKQAVESVLNQTLPGQKYEIILTKNFDTEYDSEWEQKGIKLIHFDGSAMGPRIADALPHCRGKVIAFLDDDDWWEPNKLEHIASIWRKHPNTAYYHHSMIFEFEETGDEAWRRVMVDFSKEWKRIYPWHNGSSTIIAKEILLDKFEYLKKISTIDTFLFFIAHIAHGRLMSDNALLTHFRVPAMPRQGREDRRRKDWLLIKGMIVESGNRGLLRYYDHLVAGNLTYWDCVEKIKDGEKVEPKEFLLYTAHCIRFHPRHGLRRWLILGAALVSPRLASKAYGDGKKAEL